MYGDWDLFGVHRGDEVFDQRVEIAGGQVLPLVRLGHAVAAIATRAAGLDAELFDQLVAQTHDVHFLEVLDDPLILGHVYQHAFDDALDTGTLAQVVVEAVILGWLVLLRATGQQRQHHGYQQTPHQKLPCTDR